MIEVNGYKAFHGVMRIAPPHASVEPFAVEADWLFRPSTECWHNNYEAFPADICEIISEMPKTCKHNYIEKQVEKGVTVQVLECADCGDVSIGWYREG